MYSLNAPRRLFLVAVALLSSFVTYQICYVVLCTEASYRATVPLKSAANAAAIQQAVAGLYDPRDPFVSEPGSADCCECQFSEAESWRTVHLEWNEATPAVAPLRPKGLPIIYIITPTKQRAGQKADLTRFANTLRQVPALHWIVVEDAETTSPLVAGVLARSGMAGSYTHLAISTLPAAWWLPRWKNHRGVEQRNFGIEYLRGMLNNMVKTPHRPHVIVMGQTSSDRGASNNNNNNIEERSTPNTTTGSDNNNNDNNNMNSNSYSNSNNLVPIPRIQGIVDTRSMTYKQKRAIQVQLQLQALQYAGSAAHAVNGLIYFADDDNSYDLRVFERMRFARHLPVWPVGIVGGLWYEGPLVDPDSGSVKWHAEWRPEREFPIDMAGFAIHLRHVLSTTGDIVSRASSGGYLETDVLSNFAQSRKDVEAVADSSRGIYVWHTRTVDPVLDNDPAIAFDPTIEV
ncbi:galactosylgalactosylxylosylprotein 3-beta-glucuronosyltransferase 1 [Capsaspora owczarzaki ATCC 30864]|uniref:Galactosylgalactosylxylosylprotein 3-beta-glucuronosyltransferase 1 n=1 Tax=Capsaspora owczarzaki (strain ATCC 30864) TaxID=595528 RepID=A0A0D2UR10_CAPO3|nr:galactosylgalactosylxylosylprotein 3-beta-glucuronosyltransferase 1 [Capsaspora owczarzaki ATCC 30864]KJE97456.1 galactosylgalactosylxylosylprotein 3-beta-glucuronosyltransferase 1 [Capsaspora owczarzaki ATCC 30864]|eukprot:XP_004343171.1 galactosylgalactosylxylosylprotein 3-beta-glucuronosyltransferase 1 [Capsaspora owczarzaki ATCC 30864]